MGSWMLRVIILLLLLWFVNVPLALTEPQGLPLLFW
jgi:hypothetical protein